MASCEFFIEVDQANEETRAEGIQRTQRRWGFPSLRLRQSAASKEKKANGIRRTQRCYDFPSWRLRRAAANKEEFDTKVAESADVNAKDLNGRTALHEAAKAGNFNVASYLLSRGAQIDVQDDRGTTPLLDALRSNHGDLARIILAERRRREEAACSLQRVGSPERRIARTNRSPIWSRWKKQPVKWLVIIVNLGLELCQVVASEEEANGIIGGKRFRDLTAVCAWISLLVSVAELVYEAKKNGVKWRYFSPGLHARVFGSFMLWFGLISSTIQSCINTVALVEERAVVKVDYLALLLAICLLLAAFNHGENGEKRTMAGAVKCVAHGECRAEGAFTQGVWVFECSRCLVDKLEDESGFTTSFPVLFR